jgi:hypothetical protein
MGWTRVLIVLALLTATATAFAVAERVKLERSPISGPSVTPFFSPVCRCPTAAAAISFRLRRADRLTIGVANAQGRVVRTLVSGRDYPAGRVQVAWDGRNDDGRILPQAVYRPHVHFDRKRRSILFVANPITLDVTRPKIVPTSVQPRRISPDGDGIREGIAVRYALSEPGSALLYVDGVRRVRGRAHDNPPGQLQWYGRVGGKPLPAGSYRLTLVGADRAGNRSRPQPAGSVEIRYVTLAERAVQAREGRRFTVHVTTDARSYGWRFQGRSGTSGERELTLLARVPGRHALVVGANGHEAKALVSVKPKPKPPKKKKKKVTPMPRVRSASVP